MIDHVVAYVIQLCIQTWRWTAGDGSSEHLQQHSRSEPGQNQTGQNQVRTRRVRGGSFKHGLFTRVQAWRSPILTTLACKASPGPS